MQKLTRYIVINSVQPTYTVAFNANSGTGTMENQEFTYKTSQALTTNSFTKSNFTFAGWNTESDGSGTSFDDEEIVNNLTGVG